MIFGYRTKTRRTSGFGKLFKCRTNQLKFCFGNESRSEKDGAKVSRTEAARPHFRKGAG